MVGQKPHVDQVILYIREWADNARSTGLDGWTAKACKKTLVDLKWLIEDELEDCPVFAGEKEWEQERLIELLKRK